MKRSRSWTLLAPVAVCALLTGWIVLSAANVQAASVSLLIYGLANLIVYTDAIDFLLRLHVRTNEDRQYSDRRHAAKRERRNPREKRFRPRMHTRHRCFSIAILCRLEFPGARGGSRTRTPRKARDFKSPAYAIPPPGH